MNPNQKTKRSGSWFLGVICLAGLMLTLSGCGLLRFHSSAPKAQVTTFQLRTNIPPEVTLTVLQLQVMRFADTYVSAIAQAADDFTKQVDTPQARLAALRFKLGQATAAYTDATGLNPVVNALDMLVLVTVSRMAMEDYGRDTYGDAVLPVISLQRRMETNLWDMSSAILKPDQQQELRNLIHEWRVQNPHLRYVGNVRFREFVAAMGKLPPPSKVAPNSIFSLLMLDPFSGLDPTAAAIEETRQLGERAMYYTQRMPQLISWQTELLAYQLAVQPESVQVLSNANQLATSAELFAKTSQQLPQVIAEQRQAAIQQLLDGLRSQETDVHGTLTAGSEAATAINGAIKSLDEFVRYVSTPKTNATMVSTNHHPFNVLEYGTAATQIGSAARDLTAMLNSLNVTAPEMGKLREETTAQANQVVDHATRSGIILILFFLVGCVLSALTYRVICYKWLNIYNKKLDTREESSLVSQQRQREEPPFKK